MIQTYSNKITRVFKISAWNIIGLLFILLILYFCYLMSRYSDLDGSLVYSYVFIALMPITVILYWFFYFRYIFNYARVNRGLYLQIDHDSSTIEVKKSLHTREKILQITEVTLVIHETAEREYILPINTKEKIMNYLGDGPKGRFKNLWYIQIKTQENKVSYLTPIMLGLKDLPFNNVEVDCVRKLLIKDYGS